MEVTGKGFYDSSIVTFLLPGNNNDTDEVVAFSIHVEQLTGNRHTMLGLLRKESSMLNILIRWLVFLHVLSVLTFFLMHGSSAAMAFRIRKETDFARIRAMLDLSESTIEIMFVSFLAMGLTGVALPFLSHSWDKAWVWVSILLMVFVFLWMVWMNERAYKILRKLVGLPYRQGSKEYPAEPPASAEAVAAHVKNMDLTGLIVVGFLIPAFVLWLMIFKPF